MQVLILLSEFHAAQQVATFCEMHNLRYWLAENLVQVQALLAEQPLDLVFLDLQFADATWQRLAQAVKQQHPKAQIIGVTSKTTATVAVQLRQHGIHWILHKPLTPERIEQLLLRLPEYQAQTLGLDQVFLPSRKLRFPLRFKLVLPYLLLSLVVMIVGLLLVSRVIVETIEERFQRQLVDAGLMTADHLVKEEQALLTTWRALAFTTQVPQLLAQGDAEALRALILPNVINDEVDAVDFIQRDAESTLLSLRRTEEATVYTALSAVSFAEAPFAQDAFLQRTGNQYRKYAGRFREQGRELLYIAGPVLDAQQETVGVLLVGVELARLASAMKQGVLANPTFYDQHGNPLTSTLASVEMPPSLAPEQVAGIVQNQAQASLVRQVFSGSSEYREILGVWRTGRGDVLGFYGVSLTRALLIRLATDLRLQLVLWVSLAILVVTILGLYLANRMTAPLVRLIRASSAVASGNLDVQVETTSGDEISLLIDSFNRMVSQLRENVIYRDLLGRAVSLPVREQLRQAFYAGELRLSGQDVTTTVLISDIRNFTAFSERADATTVLGWLNEYFSELVPVISGNNGVINSFAGDSLMAFFGVLPKPVTEAEGAYQACLAATEMCALIERLNDRRSQRGEPPLVTGIALHSGIAAAGLRLCGTCAVHDYWGHGQYHESAW
ncbi:MAG: HAMP domain-containing protein [Caldilineaceae bacterium]